MLLLTLERIGIDRPSLYAELIRHAEQLSPLDATRGHTALAQYQGAIALVARLVRVRSIDRAQAESLLAALASVPLNRNGDYAGGIARWLQSTLQPILPTGDGLEDALIDALAGSRTEPPDPVSWEGHDYRIDLVTPEAERLRRIRERQGGVSIDDALDLYATALGQDAAVAKTLLEGVDVALADALLAIAYAIDLGDPNGPVRFGSKVGCRHDFGFSNRNDDRRARAAWALPKQVFKDGVPWHVEGSALGLDVALAPLALRRTSDEPPASAPTLTALEREAFAASLALIDPRALRDADRDLIAEATARGERRVAALGADNHDVDSIAREIGLDGWRVRALRWTLAHEPGRARSFFSMTELLYLGGGHRVDLSAWGMSALNAHACLCTQLASPGPAPVLNGRPQLGLLTTTVADLNLRVAVALHDLHLPAALAKSVLSAAVLDFMDHTTPSDPDDWLTLVRDAQGVSLERIEDYVAAAAAGGPLVPRDAAPKPLRGRR